ncbi:transposase [Burkholderia sp. OAS925]
MLPWGTYVTVPIKEIMDTVTEFTEVKGARKYRRRTADEKRQIVEETLSSGRSVAEIARSHEVNANQVFDWRKQYLDGRLGADERGCALLPVTVNEASDGGVAEPAASTPAAPAPGTIRIQLPRGEVHVEGSVDPNTLRVVIQCLSR